MGILSVLMGKIMPVYMSGNFLIVCWLQPKYVWRCHQMETFSALLVLWAGNSPVNSPHKGQWRGALLFSLIFAWINGWVNSRESDDLRRHCAHYGVIVMCVASLQISRFPECIEYMDLLKNCEIQQVYGFIWVLYNGNIFKPFFF